MGQSIGRQDLECGGVELDHRRNLPGDTGGAQRPPVVALVERVRGGVAHHDGGEGRDATSRHGAVLGDALWREEVFGPVLTVRRARDDSEALDLVNDSRFGLSAAVFTDNLRAVTAAIERVDVGVLHINSETAGADPHVPFGGVKQSGDGPKEQGGAARDFFTTTKTVYLRASDGPHR